MRLLLDTHYLLWFLEDNPRLPLKAKALIEDLQNEVFVSSASWFEITIKIAIAKLSLPDSIEETISRSNANNIRTLGFETEHFKTYLQIPVFEDHRDPFDRIILATAIAENCILLTQDPKFSKYSDRVKIWD